MEKLKIDITEEDLKDLSIDEITDLKLEVEDLLESIENILETCDDALNS